MKPPLLLAASYLLLLGAWTMSHPPGAAPDEYGHYLRAVAAGRGEFAPSKPLGPPTEDERLDLALTWQRSQSRLIEIKGRFSPDNFDCGRLTPIPSWHCPEPGPPPDETFEVKSVQGTYPPYAYVLPGLFTRLGDDAVSALIWGRAAASITAWLLLAVGLWMVWDPKRSWVSMLGIIAAITPMVIFVGSSLSGSGLEIAAGVCFFSGLMRLTRPGAKATGPVWAATALSGALLAVARDLGLAWLVLAVLAALGLSGIAGLRASFREGGKAALFATSLICAALVAAVMWQVMVQVHPPVDLAGMRANLGSSFLITKEILRQEVGVFGWLDTVMPSWAYLVWGAMISALLLLALVAGDWRQRLVVAASAGGAILLPVVVDLAQREVGFGAQGRHVLAMTVAVPLVAGEVLSRNIDRIRWLRPVAPAMLFGASAAGVQVVAWYVDGKRHMVGMEGPFRFWEGLESTPPLGWITWGVVAAIGGLMIIGAGVRASVVQGKV